MFFNEYPYNNLTDLNLDYILRKIKELSENLNNFIKINTIKYANPIQWNITKQYEANTVVMDANSGIAYLSVVPVPSGINIVNTDYWTPIFTLNLLSANQNITLRDDGNGVLSTFSSVAGDWLIWGGVLYKVTQTINVNEAYVPGYNITRYTVELFIQDATTDLISRISGLNANIGNLANLTTTDKTSAVAAINELMTRLSGLNTNIGNLANLTTTDQSSAVAAINELMTRLSGLNTNIGNLANLTTTDKSSVVAAINEVKSSLTTNRRIIALSDSYGMGRGGATPWHDYLQTILDIDNADFFALAEGSMGFNQMGDGGHTAKTLLQANSANITDHDTITDVVILLGGNDWANITGLDTAMVDCFDYIKGEYPNAKIWLGYDYNQLTKNTSQVGQYHDTIIIYYETAANNGVLWIDNLMYVMHNANYFINDGVHPNSAGGEALARCVANYLVGGSCDVKYYKSCAYASVSTALTTSVKMSIDNGTCSIQGAVGIDGRSFSAGNNDVKIGTITDPLFTGVGVAQMMPVFLALTSGATVPAFVYLYNGDVYLFVKLSTADAIGDYNVMIGNVALQTLDI